MTTTRQEQTMTEHDYRTIYPAGAQPYTMCVTHGFTGNSEDCRPFAMVVVPRDGEVYIERFRTLAAALAEGEVVAQSAVRVDVTEAQRIASRHITTCHAGPHAA